MTAPLCSANYKPQRVTYIYIYIESVLCMVALWLPCPVTKWCCHRVSVRLRVSTRAPCGSCAGSRRSEGPGRRGRRCSSQCPRMAGSHSGPYARASRATVCTTMCYVYSQSYAEQILTLTMCVLAMASASKNRL